VEVDGKGLPLLPRDEDKLGEEELEFREGGISYDSSNSENRTREPWRVERPRARPMAGLVMVGVVGREDVVGVREGDKGVSRYSVILSMLELLES
jgi:hypothetical protein